MAGWLLVLGSVSFIVGAANPGLGQVWSAPLETQLRLIHDAATAWTATNALFFIATVLTAVGLWFVPDRVGERGLMPARAATLVYLVGATGWLASLVFRLSVTPAAAAAFVVAGQVEPAYVTTTHWASGMFGAFTYLAGGSLVALGVAVIIGRALPAASGWFAIVTGTVIAGGYAAFGDMPPFVAYVPTGLLGLVLLPRRSRSDAHRRRMVKGSG